MEGKKKEFRKKFLRVRIKTGREKRARRNFEREKKRERDEEEDWIDKRWDTKETQSRDEKDDKGDSVRKDGDRRRKKNDTVRDQGKLKRHSEILERRCKVRRHGQR